VRFHAHVRGVRARDLVECSYCGRCEKSGTCFVFGSAVRTTDDFFSNRAVSMQSTASECRNIPQSERGRRMRATLDARMRARESPSVSARLTGLLRIIELHHRLMPW
jgi:hypothetical protein